MSKISIPTLIGKTKFFIVRSGSCTRPFTDHAIIDSILEVKVCILSSKIIIRCLPIDVFYFPVRTGKQSGQSIRDHYYIFPGSKHFFIIGKHLISGKQPGMHIGAAYFLTIRNAVSSHVSTDLSDFSICTFKLCKSLKNMTCSIKCNHCNLCLCSRRAKRIF